MSNQHDNIYNILGKLDALTPKQAPAESAPAKAINESVEARGSVLSGVAKVEARLAQQFAEASDWSNLGAEYRSTKPGTREPTHTGEKEYFKGGVRHTKDFDKEVSHTAATGEKRGRGRPKKSQFEEDQVEEGGKFGGERQDAIDAGKDEFEVDGKTYPVQGKRTMEEGFPRIQAARKKFGDDGLAKLRKKKEAGASPATMAATRKELNQYDKKKGVAESINFAEMMKEQHQTVDEYLAELNADIDTFKKSGHMSEKLRDSLEMHKFSKKQLNDAAKKPALAPAPTATAVVAPAPKPPGMMQRAGSAIAGGINKVIGHPSDAEMLDRLKKDTMGEDLDQLARLAGISEGLKGGQKKLDKNKNGKLDADDFKRLRDKVDEATVDEDMIKAKKDYDGDGKVETGSEEHAGSVDKAIKKAQAKKDLDEETHGQYLTQKEKEAQASGKKSFQAFKQTHPVDGKPGVEEEDEESLEEAKLPMKTVNGRKVPAFAADGKGKNDLQKEKVDECGPEMSPFSSMGHDEPESGMTINSSMDTKTGRKTLTVTADGEAAEELAQMLKMAGMGGQSQEPKAVVIASGPDEAVEEERESQYANTPDEEVENIDSIMHQGTDLNREKEQYKHSYKQGDNPMAMHRESIEMPKSLSRMLEAIKMVEEGKCNHTDKGEKCPVHGMKECSGMYEGFLGKLFGTEKKKKAAGELRPYMVYDKFTIYYDPVDHEYVTVGTGEYQNKFEAKPFPADGGLGGAEWYGISKTGGGGVRDPLKVNKEALRGLQEAKPSAGMSKGEKSSLVKKARAGGDIGKPGKSFDKVAKAAGGGEKGKRIAAAAMWKNAAK